MQRAVLASRRTTALVRPPAARKAAIAPAPAGRCVGGPPPRARPTFPIIHCDHARPPPVQRPLVFGGRKCTRLRRHVALWTLFCKGATAHTRRAADGRTGDNPSLPHLSPVYLSRSQRPSTPAAAPGAFFASGAAAVRLPRPRPRPCSARGAWRRAPEGRRMRSVPPAGRAGRAGGPNCCELSPCCCCRLPAASQRTDRSAPAISQQA
jgi:hypothetical protein